MTVYIPLVGQNESGQWPLLRMTTICTFVPANECVCCVRIAQKSCACILRFLGSFALRARCIHSLRLPSALSFRVDSVSLSSLLLHRAVCVCACVRLWIEVCNTEQNFDRTQSVYLPILFYAKYLLL